MYCAQLNDIHGHVIKTKPTECFRGSGGYKRSQVGLIHALLLQLLEFTPYMKFLEGLLLY